MDETDGKHVLLFCVFVLFVAVFVFVLFVVSCFCVVRGFEEEDCLQN